MAEDLVTTEFELPVDCGYNRQYSHDWETSVYGLGMHLIPEIHNLCTGNWGWYFIPHENCNYYADDWHENQTLVLSFEKKWDLIMCKLIIDINK